MSSHILQDSGSSLEHNRGDRNFRHELRQTVKRRPVGHQGRDESSSSMASSHHRVFSAANSQITTTDENSHNEDAGPAVQDGEHSIQICESQSRGGQLRSGSIILRRDDVQNYSARIYRMVNQDFGSGRSNTRIIPEDRISTDALRTVVYYIKQPLPMPNDRRAYDRLDMTFDRLFDLAVVLWSYKCRADQWTPIAEHFKQQDWEQDFNNLTPHTMPQWLYLALVFDWPDVFIAASKELIANCTKLRGELDRAWFLPDELIAAIEHQRTVCMKDAYNKVQGEWFRIYRPNRPSYPLKNLIHDSLFTKWSFTLNEPIPLDLHQRASPEKLLVEVENTTADTHTEGRNRFTLNARTTTEQTLNTDQASTTHTRKPRDPNQIALDQRAESNRRSESAEALSYIVKRLLQRKKNKTESLAGTTLDETVRVEQDQICEGLMQALQEFRDAGFLHLDLADFRALRSANLLVEEDSLG